MLKSKEVKLGTGILVFGFATAINACTPAVREVQPAINPAETPLPAPTAELKLTDLPAYGTRLQTPTENAALAATSTPKPDNTATAVPPTKVPDTATAVATAPATAAATAPAKIEAPRFKSYGVYKGLAENGGAVLFATLPNEDLIFHSLIEEPRCSNDNYEFFFDAKGKYQANLGNFAFPAGSTRTKVIRVLLKNGEIAEGSILEKGYSGTSPKGPFTCPANEVKFTAKLVGQDKEALIQAWGDLITTRGSKRPTDDQIIAGIENAYKGTLPPD